MCKRNCGSIPQVSRAACHSNTALIPCRSRERDIFVHEDGSRRATGNAARDGHCIRGSFCHGSAHCESTVWLIQGSAPGVGSPRTNLMCAAGTAA